VKRRTTAAGVTARVATRVRELARAIERNGAGGDSARWRWVAAANEARVFVVARRPSSAPAEGMLVRRAAPRRPSCESHATANVARGF